MKMELFKKKFNAGHWRTLQAICACSQICNWSTDYMPWCLEIPPNCLDWLALHLKFGSVYF